MDTQDRLSLFPISADIDLSGRLTIVGHDLEELASIYGTPLYLYDALTVQHQAEGIFSTLHDAYPGKTAIAYAAKAYFSLRFARNLKALGLEVDVASLGELRIARMAGFDPQEVHFHGNGKSDQELEESLEWGVHAIAVDNMDELEMLEVLAQQKRKPVNIWLRITPDLGVETHPHINTSHTDSKFGFHIRNGDAIQAIRKARASRWLNLTGLHTHLGSQLFKIPPYSRAIQMLFELAEQESFIPLEMSPGGGWGVRYTLEQPMNDLVAWIQGICSQVQDQCSRLNWPFPRLVLEPGRLIIAQAGVVVYRVASQKDTPDGSHIVAVDGGMADNPRPALYQASYTALPVRDPQEEYTIPTRIVGKYCESGDELIHEVMLPHIRRGDLLAIPVTGAYQLSMSSNYNLAARPAVLWLEGDQVRVLQARLPPEEDPWWI